MFLVANYSKNFWVDTSQMLRDHFEFFSLDVALSVYIEVIYSGSKIST